MLFSLELPHPHPNPQLTHSPFRAQLRQATPELLTKSSIHLGIYRHDYSGKEEWNNHNVAQSPHLRTIMIHALALGARSLSTSESRAK